MHRYAEHQSFERLLLLIATILQYPGVGCPDPMNPKQNSPDKHHDAIDEVRLRFLEVAAEFKVDLPIGYPSTPTLRKDLETLRKYGILDKRMYRWGYYLGTGAMSLDEFKVAINALDSQAKFQGDPQIRRIHETLTQRLRGLDLELGGVFFYPIRQYLNKAIVYTDPEEMIALGKNRDNLFHQLSKLEKAIISGQAIEISRSSNPYTNTHIGLQRVYPLQLIYNDIAWYLLYEYTHNKHLAIGRLNRFRNYCRIIEDSERGVSLQRESLAKAYQLLENGWGLFLGEVEAQQQELEGNLEFVTVKVRFFPPVTKFIIEGERRHLKQKITLGPSNETTGEPSHVDYIVPLPPRSLNEFMLWVYRHLENAQIIYPRELVEKHYQAAIALIQRYQKK
ncbi:MAG: WYL domain-containing protein [Scytonematopsis contorta HA4267-MV1]|jgi:hypothetical protein|nr:WYL domain-containing protein [Scytonematopsis contorta HA4267-MV1]